MDLEIQFANAQQREFFYATERNQCFSGGFNNGKTYSGCLKIFTLLSTFPNYRAAIARQVYADLKRTTMQTFFKLCPVELIERHNEQDGLTVLKNKSTIFWLHLDKVDENTLRGLEVNSILVDQAEETEEKVYDVLDARLGRWDNVEIPQALLDTNPNWPRNRKTNKLIAPSYMMLLTNPDTQYHYIYRKYHPESLTRDESNFFIEGEWDSGLGSEESYTKALGRDAEWVSKYVRGQWGISNAQIHRLLPESSLDYDEEFVKKLQAKGNLFRSLDHGDSSPTCCLWFAVYGGVYICYREYYVPNDVISSHRQAIFDLSYNERYSANYADPQIFKKTAQKQGGFWSVSDEYLTKELDAPAIAWLPADNNEFSTRNRINELLKPTERFKHPITGVSPAPGIYFIKRSTENAFGAYHAITELQSQRRKLLGYYEGKAIYCDDREESVTDHAYDCIRYFVAQHGSPKSEQGRPISKNTLKFFHMIKKMQKGALVAASA